MKPSLKLNIRFILLYSIFAPLVLLAQSITNAPASVPAPPAVPGVSGANTSLLLTLIPLAVPIIVSIIKRLTDFLPSWSLPILASGLGELINYVSGLFGGPSTTALNGILLGAAGTGLREVLDQVKYRVVNGSSSNDLPGSSKP